MSIAADCYGCMVGNHDQHARDWNITPGLIGGAYCDCAGDCVERSAEALQGWLDWLGPMAKNGGTP